MLKILIADDHAVVRRGLKEILKEKYPFAIIEEVGDAEALVIKATKEDWSIVITDLSMPGRNGIEALHLIKIHKPLLPVMIVSVYPEEQYAIRVLKAGASGYLNKDMAPEELVNAVERVLSGRKYITAAVAENLASAFDGPSNNPAHQQLSDREFEVFKMLSAGKSVSEIGHLLHLSVTTISTYRSRILSKMNMKNNAGLTQYAIEHKLI